MATPWEIINMIDGKHVPEGVRCWSPIAGDAEMVLYIAISTPVGIARVRKITGVGVREAKCEASAKSLLQMHLQRVISGITCISPVRHVDEVRIDRVVRPPRPLRPRTRNRLIQVHTVYEKPFPSC